MNEELIRYYLERVITVGLKEVTSTHTVEIATDDPFRTKEVIIDKFPGWRVVAFESATDREYQDMFENPNNPHSQD